MRIIHVITGLGDGGAEKNLYQLCSHDELNTHIVFSLMDKGKYGTLLHEEGITVHQLNMPQGRVTISGMVKLYRLIRSLKPDVVQTWMYHADIVGGVLARLAGVNRVFWGVRSALEPGKSRRSTIAIAHLNARLSHWIPAGIVCCAERARETQQTLGFDIDKLVVIPNGYDLNHFKPDTTTRLRLREEWGVDHDMALLGMVGRFNPLKDHENLLRALTLLKQRNILFRCVLVGHGLDADNVQLVAWLEQYNLRNEVLLLSQRSDVPAVMSALDLHVLSSSNEAFPNVLAEAMACGTPCVTTDVGDAAFIVGDTGWIIPPSDSVQLAGAIQSALATRGNITDWQIRCEAARMRVIENFSLKKMIAAYHAVWGRDSKER
ncbi:glycosyltransferase [uncultured Nitrosomonas sp.]|uniref:glycosyltransferase family 4 protein n=1 Tax=uncultured Nitrosomonas sp. TaxID=156424 RepID=UPI0025CFFE4B|nr:glycosyltransferase [uncultured Nitrosomonas sp.]